MSSLYDPTPAPGRSRPETAAPGGFGDELVAHGAAVQAYLRRHLSRPGDVDDLTQEVLLAALAGRSPFEGRASARSWLLGIARHKLLTFLRDEGRRRLTPGDPIARRLHEAQIERVGHENPPLEHGERLEHCLDRLRPRQRRLLERIYGEGETAESVARREERGAGAVRMELLRLRTVLRRCMEGLR